MIVRAAGSRRGLHGSRIDSRLLGRGVWPSGLCRRSAAAGTGGDFAARLALHGKRRRTTMLRAQLARRRIRMPGKHLRSAPSAAARRRRMVVRRFRRSRGLCGRRAGGGCRASARGCRLVLWNAKPARAPSLQPERAHSRPGAAPAAGPRVCVDFDPDFPDGVANHWRCRYSYERGVQRVCQRAGAGAANRGPLAMRCTLASTAATAARDTASTLRPAPDCWLDSDCKSSACRFGSCMPVER